MAEKNNEKKTYEKDKTTYSTKEPVSRKKCLPCPPPKPKPVCAEECGKIIIENGTVNIYVNCCSDDCFDFKNK